jgi:hypothetical protein
VEARIAANQMGLSGTSKQYAARNFTVTVEEDLISPFFQQCLLR